MTTNKQRKQDGPQGKTSAKEEERRRKQVLAAGMAGAGAVGAAAGAGAVLAGQEILERRDTAAEGDDPSAVQSGNESTLDVFDALGQNRGIPVVTAPSSADEPVTRATQDGYSTPRAAQEDDPTDALPDVFDDRSGVVGRRPVAQTRPGETRPEPAANVGETATVIAATDVGNVTVPPVMRVTPQPAASSSPEPVAQAGPGPQAAVTAPQTSTPVQPAQPTSSPESVPAAGDVQPTSPSNGAPPVVDAPVASPPSTDASSAAPPSSDTAAGVETVPSTPAGPSGTVDTSPSSPSEVGSDSEPAPGQPPAPPVDEQSEYPQEHDDAPPPVYGQGPVDAGEMEDVEPPVDFGPDHDYGYPRVIAYNVDQGVVRVAVNDEGFILEYREDGSVYRVDEHGNLHGWTFGPGQGSSLLDVDHQGNARFEHVDGTIYELDTHGNYELVYEPDEPPVEDAYPPEDEVEEAYPPEHIDDADGFDPAWASYYDSSEFGYEHPYNVYGPPTAIEQGNDYVLYTFGDGAAQVYRQNDGSFYSLTWRSFDPEVGVYIDYQAHVALNANGDWVTTTEVYPLDLDHVPNLGNILVDGTPRLDPWQEFGGEDMAQSIYPGYVEQTWTIDDGPVTKLYYRDGSGRTEIHYPDGVVVTYLDGETSYTLPVGWVPGEEQDDAPPTYEDEPGDETDGFDMADREDVVPGDLQPINGVNDLFSPEYEYLPAGAPEVFEYNGETYPNPELDESFTYQYSTQSGAHYYTDESGYTIVVTPNDDGTTTMLWGNPVANNGNWDMQATVQANGQYAPTEAFEVTPIAMEGFIVGTLNPDLFADDAGHLPPDLPDYFVNDNYPNPETDASYALVSSETTPTGLGTHHYADAEGNTVTVATGNGQSVQIAWVDADGNQNLIVTFNAEGEWTPSLYNPDEYTPPGQAAPDTEPEAGSPAADEPDDEPGLGYGLIEDPRYPHGVATNEFFTDDLPDNHLRTHVEGVGWVREEDITPEDHTFLAYPVGYYRNEFLEDHIWTGVVWVAKDDIEEGVNDFFFDGPGNVFVTDIQAQTAADPEDAPQAGELPTGPELSMPETPSIVPAEEEAAPATETAAQTVTYPLVLDWGAGMEGSWVRVAQADGNTYEYHAGDPTTYLVTDSGVVATNTPAPSLMHVGSDGAAIFQHSSGSFYFQWNTAGGQSEVAESALPFAVDAPYVEPAAEEAAPQAEPVAEAPIDFEVTEEVVSATTESVEQPPSEVYEVPQAAIPEVEDAIYATTGVEQPELADSLEVVDAEADDDDGMP